MKKRKKRICILKIMQNVYKKKKADDQKSKTVLKIFNLNLEKKYI